MAGSVEITAIPRRFAPPASSTDTGLLINYSDVLVDYTSQSNITFPEHASTNAVKWMYVNPINNARSDGDNSLQVHLHQGCALLITTPSFVKVIIISVIIIYFLCYT